MIFFQMGIPETGRNMKIDKSLDRIPEIALIIALMAVFLPNPARAAAGGKPPHMEYPTKLFSLDTGYILGEGANVQIGLGETGFGLRDRVQFTTNTLLDIATMINFQLKGALLKESDRRPALAVLIGYYNLAGSYMAVDYIVEKALDENNIDLSSGFEVFAANISLTKKILPKVRLHIGYQYKYAEGHSDSNEPVSLNSEGDSVTVDAGIRGQVHHRSFLGAVDFDPLEHVKLIAELGFDFTYKEFRGGAGVRFGVLQSFALQLGVMWPGIDIDEGIKTAVMPHLSLFWRF
jgi:hypothetical protein